MHDNIRNTSEALDAIHEEALKALMMPDLTETVESRLELILSLARYKSDVRTAAEAVSAIPAVN